MKEDFVEEELAYQAAITAIPQLTKKQLSELIEEIETEWRRRYKLKQIGE